MSVKARDAARSRKALQKENAKLRKDQEDLRNRLASGEKEILRLTEALSDLKTAGRIEELEREIERSGENLVDIMGTIKEKDARLADFERKNKQLLAELVKQRGLIASLQKEAELLIQASFQPNRCDETCPFLRPLSKACSDGRRTHQNGISLSASD